MASVPARFICQQATPTPHTNKNQFGTKMLTPQLTLYLMPIKRENNLHKIHQRICLFIGVSVNIYGKKIISILILNIIW